MGRTKQRAIVGKSISLADQRSRIVGMLQSEIARKLKCSQTTVSFVESGELAPPDIKVWSKAYKISVMRFCKLHELQCQLPLWKFARKKEKAERKAISKLA